MDIVHFLGYFSALFIGLVLGLIGGGGSILTVPIFVYILGINPVIATAYSLFVVGCSSAVGAYDNFKKGRINLKSSLVFAIPAVFSIFCTRKFIVPAIPQHLFNIGLFEVTKEILIMVLFAILMILASFSMIFKKKLPKTSSSSSPKYGLTVLFGIITGIVTGFVGAGGGFMIVPILIFLVGLEMKEAVGTSLFIIALNSIIGFTGDLSHLEIAWSFLLSFTAISIIGIFLGIYLNKFLKPEGLKKIFGWLVLVMGIYIIWRELSISVF
ncbi:sulfite exporter TauE/SafE family protein [Zunongwangia sp.]|uniref:sulfite exporter TauE/SafE family protein n=1 Tax=Zunongwangia sp. TaxID=1965325 RepID=UPI003AA8EE56